MKIEEGVEFLTKTKFSKMVESVVREHRLSHMDAILHLCEENGIEPEDCKKYVNNVIKEKVEAEAQALNFFPQTNKLPI